MDKSNKGPLWGLDSVVGRVEILEVATEPDANSAPVVPSVRIQRDEWNINSTAYTLAAMDSDSDALLRFYHEHFEIENAIREHESLYQATDESIRADNAVALATRIRNLHLSHSFDGHADYIDFLAGQCLKLKEGQAAGEVCTAVARLEVANPPPAFPEWCGWLTIKLAVPAKLNAAFGIRSFIWLRYRSEDFTRDFQLRGFPPGSLSSRSLDGGSFAFSLDPESRSSKPELRAVPVVPAPDEDTIAHYIERAASSADHWDALVKVAEMLREHRQPFGDALSDWLIEASRLATRRRPKGSTWAKRPANALRNHAIIEAVSALVRCGMKAVTNVREPGPACEAVAVAFSLSPETVRNLWKKRHPDTQPGDQIHEMVGP